MEEELDDLFGPTDDGANSRARAALDFAAVPGRPYAVKFEPGLDFAACRDVRLPDGSLSPPPPHVKEGVAALVANPWLLLADEMGGMKTAQTIIAAQFLHERGAIDRVIVVAPAAVRPVWTDPEIGELAKHLFMRSVVADFHTETKAWRHEAGDGSRELQWIVSNYEWLRGGSWETLLSYCGPRTMLVLDESAAVKNWKSLQTKACRKLRAGCGRVVLLNGTPYANGPEDLFAQGNMMHESILQCKYVTSFRMRYAKTAPILGLGGRPIKDKRGNQVQGIVGWDNLDDLQRRLAPYVLRRLTKDCLNLPGVLPPVTLTVKLSPATWKLYREMRDNLVAYLEGGGAAAVTHAAIKVMRLAQITSGFLGGVDMDEDGGDYLDFGTPDADDLALLGSIDFGAGVTPGIARLPRMAPPQAQAASDDPPAERVLTVEEIGREKLDATLDAIAERFLADPNLKVLVWCRFAPELRRFLAECHRRWPGIQIGALSGQSMLGRPQGKERAEALRLLNPQTAPPGPAIVGGTYGTGALGLNLTAAYTMINMSYDYSHFKFVQALARVDRPGQTRPVHVTDVVAVGPKGQKTIDHAIIGARKAKAELAELGMREWIRILKQE